jgi:hypothetical protein
VQLAGESRIRLIETPLPASDPYEQLANRLNVVVGLLATISTLPHQRAIVKKHEKVTHQQA